MFTVTLIFDLFLFAVKLKSYFKLLFEKLIFICVFLIYEYL